jgi:mannose PTS system EIIA component
LIGIVVVTHGQLASELVTAAEMIVGEIPHVTGVSIGWHDDPDDAQEEIREAIERVASGQGTVVLTDMFGGTPSNLSLAFLEKDQVEVVTGVNLPMLIKLVSLRGQEGMSLETAARQISTQGKESICLASDLLQAKGKGKGKGKEEASHG